MTSRMPERASTELGEPRGATRPFLIDLFLPLPCEMSVSSLLSCQATDLIKPRSCSKERLRRVILNHWYDVFQQFDPRAGSCFLLLSGPQQQPRLETYTSTGSKFFAKILPDGTPLDDDESLVAFKGVPAGSRLIWNGSDFGQFRKARLTQITDPRQFVYQFQILRPDGSSLARTINVGPKEYIEVSLTRKLGKKLILTQLDCIRHDSHPFDRPRLIYRVDNSPNANAVQLNDMISGDSWPLRLPVLMESNASIELWDMHIWVTPITWARSTGLESENWKGVFDFDPNRTGMLYNITWRIEPIHALRGDGQAVTRSHRRARRLTKHSKLDSTTRGP